jgi:tetratricopeptide (TPR) repeat protein
LTLAQCWMITGDLEKAEASIQEVLRVKPQDRAALRLAATLYSSQNRADKAREYLDKLDRAAVNSPYEQAWANRARAALLLKSGRHADRDRALALVEQNLRTDPASIEDQGLRATILAQRPDRRPEAIKILEQMAGANRLGDNERFLLARIYLEHREPQKYQEEILRLLNRQPRDARYLVHFVDFWIGCNQLDIADRWLSELKKIEPQGIASLERETRLLDLRKRRPELLGRLKAFGREVPTEIGTVAELLNRYGFAKEAEQAYRAFVARDPGQPQRTLALAQFLARQNRVAEAMGILEKAWSTCPPEQVAAASMALYDAPSADATQRRQVEAWVAEAIRKRPDSPWLAAGLGTIWIRQGRSDEAEALCRRVLATNPDNAGALNTLAWMLAFRDRGKSQEAIALIDHAIDVLGENPSLVDTRAVARIRSGYIDRAVQELRAIRLQSPQNPSFALHLAWAYHAQGQSEQACTELEKAEKLGINTRALDPLELAVFQQLRRELFPG